MVISVRGVGFCIWGCMWDWDYGHWPFVGLGTLQEIGVGRHMQTEILESGGHQDVVPTQVDNDRLPAFLDVVFFFFYDGAICPFGMFRACIGLELLTLMPLAIDEIWSLDTSFMGLDLVSWAFGSHLFWAFGSEAMHTEIAESGGHQVMGVPTQVGNSMMPAFFWRGMFLLKEEKRRERERRNGLLVFFAFISKL